jgi:hypothetical protein
MKTLLLGSAPTWTYVASAIATCVLALAALVALVQIGQARRARVIQVMTDLSRRWDEKDMIEARVKVDAQGENLRSHIEGLFPGKGFEYYELLREPGLIEDLAVLWRRNAIDLATIDESMGVIIPERWDIWKNTTHLLRDMRKDIRVYEGFEGLAKALADRHPETGPEVLH